LQNIYDCDSENYSRAVDPLITNFIFPSFTRLDTPLCLSFPS
jgi:hypothetical protein